MMKRTMLVLPAIALSATVLAASALATPDGGWRDASTASRGYVHVYGVVAVEPAPRVYYAPRR